MLYTSETSIKGSFSPIPFSTLKISPADVLWNEVSVNIGISDPKGLKSDIQLTFNDSTLSLAPVSSNDTYSQNTFTAPFALTETGTMNTISFSGNLSLNGSEQLLFTPVGKETTVELNSPWPDPSFIGNQLPVSHSVTKDGFVATWKNLSHTRKFPQQWKDNAYTISYTQEMEKKSVDDSYNTADVARVTTPIVGTGNSVTAEAFGTSLFVPVNGYQKTMRSVKYAILCILLTFAAFFIIEMVNKKTVHPFQYGLIGLALIVFYALLLSFSEYTGFNTAYIISTLATVGLIGWFVKGILQSSRLTTILSSLLILMYSYIFTILQLQDYSLILGSIGLFLTLAVIMHFSKKIKW
jgi:inner membrane protein